MTNLGSVPIEKKWGLGDRGGLGIILAELQTNKKRKLGRDNTSTFVIRNREALAKIWDAPAPHKAKVCAWRILRSRLPTCDNLWKRKVKLNEEEMMCNACFHSPESIDHVFLACPKTGLVWDEVQKWLGSSSVRPRHISSHFEMFTKLGRGKNCDKFLEAMWMCITWVLWKQRNASRFDGKAWNIKGTLMEIKARSWSWFKEFKTLEKDFDFCNWCSFDLLPKLL
ncbi:uncharacterized protein LOC130998247 [Salvia miltiorrhiza]|uniref:uncharacterized protein LOC130998247 n=1 Tax=Salvia miltiorrhiza TaxID=226208 RepID=UPI0025AD00CF|nr:uncharacterized protein LOC130998247 [Salvia miltiorrhiza]